MDSLSNLTVLPGQEHVYIENGYSSREDYLQCLAEDFGVPIGTVAVIADILGPSEDFDGLVTALEDLDGDTLGY